MKKLSLCRAAAQRAASIRIRSRGVSALEFAIILPVMVLLVVGTNDAWRAITRYLSISDAARTGVQYAYFNLKQNGYKGLDRVLTSDATLESTGEATPLTGVTVDVACKCQSNSSSTVLVKTTDSSTDGCGLSPASIVTATPKLACPANYSAGFVIVTVRTTYQSVIGLPINLERSWPWPFL